MGSDDDVRYVVIFDRGAKGEFDRLSDGQRKALGAQLRLLQRNPAPPSSKELEDFAPLRRIKAGDARAIYQPPDVRNRIWIFKVGADHSVYDNLETLLRESE